MAGVGRVSAGWFGGSRLVGILPYLPHLPFLPLMAILAGLAALMVQRPRGARA